MNARTLAILVAVIVVLGGLAFLGQRRGPDAADTPTAAGTKLLPALESALNDVERVTVTKAGGTTVATIERGDDTWTVAEKDGYTADVARLRQALVALAEARIVEQKTANPDLYDRLGVEDVSAASAAGIAIDLEGGGDWPTIVLGDAEGSEYRYVRLANAATSYMIDKNPNVPRETVDWLERLVVDLDGSRVREVRIEHPGGARLVLRKPDAGTTDFTVENIPEGRELLYAGVANAVGNALRNLRFEDVAPAAALEPDPDQVVNVEYRTFDGLVVEIEGIEQDDEHWIRLTARAETDEAADGDEDAAGDAGGDEAGQAADADTGGSEAAAEAARINARVGGWRYRIASYQYDPITRRMSDLLKPPAED